MSLFFYPDMGYSKLVRFSAKNRPYSEEIILNHEAFEIPSAHCYVFIVLGIYNFIFSCSLRWLLTILYWSQWTDVELQLQRCQWITVVQCRLLHLCQDGKELLWNSIFRLHRCRYICLGFSLKLIFVSSKKIVVALILNYQIC